MAVCRRWSSRNSPLPHGGHAGSSGTERQRGEPTMSDSTNTTTPSTTTWNGWARLPRGRWRCLVTGAASDDEALKQLRQVTAKERLIDLVVLVEGKRPTDRPRLA